MFLGFVLNDNLSKVFNIINEYKKTKIYPCKINNHDEEIREHNILILNNIYDIV